MSVKLIIIMASVVVAGCGSGRASCGGFTAEDIAVLVRADVLQIDRLINEYIVHEKCCDLNDDSYMGLWRFGYKTSEAAYVELEAAACGGNAGSAERYLNPTHIYKGAWWVTFDNLDDNYVEASTWFRGECNGNQVVYLISLKISTKEQVYEIIDVYRKEDFNVY